LQGEGLGFEAQEIPIGECVMAIEVQRSPGVTVHEVSPTERWQIFDEAAQYYLGKTGKEFARAWDEGEFDADPDEPKTMRVALLRPDAR